MTDVEHDALPPDQFDAILRALDTAGRKLPVDAIHKARQHRAQIIPELIKVLRRATEALQREEKYDGNAPFFVLFLLTEFRASEGLPAILDAISLPGNGPFDLFGDAIHEVLPRVLITLAGEQCEEVCRALFRNAALNEYVRWSAATTLVRLAIAGLRPRADIVQTCKQLLCEVIEQNDSEAVSCLVISMIELNPREAAKEIEEAFKRHLVDEGMIDRESVQKHLQHEPMDSHGRYRHPIPIEDTIAELETWASFQEPKPVPPRPKLPASPAPPRTPLFTAKPKSTPAGPKFPIQKPRSPAVRVGRNDSCPCGSGKKFKKCCGGPGAIT